VNASELEPDLDELRRLTGDALRDAHRFEGELTELVKGLRGVDAAEEALAATSRNLQRIQQLGDVINQALELLRDAEARVQRDIAPYLAASVRDRVTVVTRGRYVDVTVNPSNLEVQLKESATGQWRTARFLSHGTREQVYLLLRAAMAQYLTTTGETPPPCSTRSRLNPMTIERSR